VLATLFCGGVVAMWFGFSITVGFAAAEGALFVFVVTDYLAFLSGVLDRDDLDRGLLRGYLLYIREFRESRLLLLDSYARSLACVALAVLSPVAFLLRVPLLLRGAVMFCCAFVAVLLSSAAPMHGYVPIPAPKN